MHYFHPNQTSWFQQSTLNFNGRYVPEFSTGPVVLFIELGFFFSLFMKFDEIASDKSGNKFLSVLK